MTSAHEEIDAMMNTDDVDDTSEASDEQKPEPCYIVLETTFTNENMANKGIQFNTVVGNLGNLYWVQVENIVHSLWASERYELLKGEIAKKSADLERRLREGEEIENDTSSQIYQELKKLVTPLEDRFAIYIQQTVTIAREEITSALTAQTDKVCNELFDAQQIAAVSRQLYDTRTRESYLPALPEQLINVKCNDGPILCRLFVTDWRSCASFSVHINVKLCMFPRNEQHETVNINTNEPFILNETNVATCDIIPLFLNLTFLIPLPSTNYDTAPVSMKVDNTAPVSMEVDDTAPVSMQVDDTESDDSEMYDMEVEDSDTEDSETDDASLKEKKIRESTYRLLLASYPDLTRPPFPGQKRKQHNVRHRIKNTYKKFIYSRPTNFKPKAVEELKVKLEQMLKQGIIRPSNSTWSSQLYCIKGDDFPRPYVNYQALNKCTKNNNYQMPYVTSFDQRVRGKTIFSKLHFIRDYYRIPIAAEDIKKTAIDTPFGKFELLIVIPELKNAAQSCQKFVNEIVRGFDFVCACVEDVLVFSETEKQHYEHLRMLFNRINDYGIVLDTTKCEFGLTEIKFLGYKVNTDGIKPLSDRIDILLNMSRPANFQQLYKYVKMLKFYDKFIPEIMDIIRPFEKLVLNKEDDKRKIVWSKQHEYIFCKANRVLADATMSVCPKPRVPIYLAVDASAFAIGAVMHQIVNGICQPIGFFSRTLSPEEQSRHIYERELMAVFNGARYFKSAIEGRDCAIYTDNQALSRVFQRYLVERTEFQRRHIHYIGKITTNIRHIKGIYNSVADMMSRVKRVSEFQFSNVEVQDLCECFALSSITSLTYYNEVPEDKSYYLHVGVIEMPYCQGYKYCLICIDYFSRRLKIIPLTDNKPSTVALEIFSCWISNHGVPSNITFQLAYAFQCQILRELNQILSVAHLRTMTYSSTYNEMAYLLYQQLKETIEFLSTMNWVNMLPHVLLMAQYNIQQGYNITPAELFYGEGFVSRMPQQAYYNHANEVNNQIQYICPYQIVHTGFVVVPCTLVIQQTQS